MDHTRVSEHYDVVERCLSIRHNTDWRALSSGSWIAGYSEGKRDAAMEILHICNRWANIRKDERQREARRRETEKRNSLRLRRHGLRDRI